MRVVSAAEIDETLDFPGLIAALETAFRSDIVVPVRHHHEVVTAGAPATLLLMPAWSGAGTADPVLGAKIVTVYPDNAARALPSVMGSYLLMDGATGAPRAVLDGARLTLWRTAAASALAARFLARRDAAQMLMVGAGALAPFLVRAHASLRPLADIAIWNRSPGRAGAVVAQLVSEGLPARLAGALEDEVRAADLIACATLSKDPLVRGRWLKPGAHLDLVGAFNLAMREADDDALRRCAVYVDTKAALTEGGDVAIGLRDGAIGPDAILGDLFDLCVRRCPGRRADDEITLFKSVGTAIEDLAAADLVVRRLSA